MIVFSRSELYSFALTSPQGRFDVVAKKFDPYTSTKGLHHLASSLFFISESLTGRRTDIVNERLEQFKLIQAVAYDWNYVKLGSSERKSWELQDFSLFSMGKVLAIMDWIAVENPDDLPMIKLRLLAAN